MGGGSLGVEQLLVEVSGCLGAIGLGVDDPGVALHLVPTTGGASQTGDHVAGLIRLVGHDVLASGGSGLGSGDKLIGGLRNLGDAELLELSLVVEVNQRAGVLRQAVSLAANLNQAVRAGCEVVLVLLGILGHILQQTLGEDLRQLGVTDLSQIRSLAGLDVGLKLLDHVRGLTIELGGLDLNIRMLLIPLGNDVVDQSHALGIRQTVHVGDVDHATIIGGLRVAGSVAAATGQAHSHCCYRGKSSHDALIARYHISTPS